MMNYEDDQFGGFKLLIPYIFVKMPSYISKSILNLLFLNSIVYTCFYLQPLEVRGSVVG
jgi:hypothetical protein